MNIIGKNFVRVAAVTAALALSGVPSFASPCSQDLDTFCGDRSPGNGSIASCLQSHYNELTYQCREWLKKMDRSLGKLKTACGAATRDYCQDVRPGYGRVHGCLMANYDKLPSDCRAALDEANK